MDLKNKEEIIKKYDNLIKEIKNFSNLLEKLHNDAAILKIQTKKYIDQLEQK